MSMLPLRSNTKINRPLPAQFSGRLWENGEFGFSRVKEFVPVPFYEATGDGFHCNNVIAVEPDRTSPSPEREPGEEGDASSLGLSHLTNSHSPKKRARRGLKGITSHGRKLVRNACYRLRAHVRARRLSLLTLTLPACSPGELEAIAGNWSELLRIFLQRLGRHLKSAGLPGELIGVSELQEKRLDRTGLPVLHLHVVFLGRLNAKPWAVSAIDVNAWWSELLRPYLPECNDFSAIHRIETIKKNVESYLGKYMSKGAGAVARLVAAGLDVYLPSSWYFCTNSLRREVFAARRSGVTVGNLLCSFVENAPASMYKYIYDVIISNDSDGATCIGKHGRLIEGIQPMLIDLLKADK